MSRASAVDVPLSVLGCFETDLHKLDELRDPTFIGSFIISSHNLWSRVDLRFVIVLCL